MKEHHKKLPTKKTSNRYDEKSTHDMDVGLRFSSSGVKGTVKVPSPQNKRRSRSCSGMTKQSSLDCYVRAVSSEKSASPLLSEPKGRATEKPRQSRKSQIRSSLSSMGSGVSQIPQSTKEIKTNSDSGDWDKTLLPKYECSPKSSDRKIQKALTKKKQADVSGSGDRLDAHNDDHNSDDCSVFEDYFTSDNDAPKRKVLVAHSSSDADRLPSFDLEPLTRIRRKSQIQENCSRNRKSKALKDTGIMEASGPPEEELAARMGTSLPRPQESGFEEPRQEPAAKKQRRKTKQNSVTLPESKVDRKHVLA